MSAAAPAPALSHAAPKTTAAAGGGNAPAVPAGVSGGKPGPSNTGVPAGTALTRVDGNQTFTSGTHSGLDIHGIVVINGNNVILQNSIVRGPDSSASCAGTIIQVNSGSGVIIRDTEVSPTAAGPCTDGVSAGSATLLRMNIHGTVDGVKAWSGTTVQDSYIHDLHLFASDPAQGGGPTHNDAVQAFGAGSNITLTHNFFNVASNLNSDFQLTQDEGIAARNITLSNNWLYGGGCSINLSSKGGAAITAANGISITGNRFGQNSTAFGCPIVMGTTVALAGFSGNVWDASGAAMTSYQQHD